MLTHLPQIVALIFVVLFSLTPLRSTTVADEKAGDSTLGQLTTWLTEQEMDDENLRALTEQ